MSIVKVRSFLKWTLITYFIALICLELYEAIAHQLFDLTKAQRILLILALIAIILFKNKYTWIAAQVIFIYGMYNIMIVGTFAATPTAMEFTQSLNQILYPQGSNDFAHRLINGFPMLFYFLTFLTFATPLVRKWYGFANFKGKSQSSYLR